jgi:hypothetical protein
MNIERCRTISSFMVITGPRALTPAAKAQPASASVFARSTGSLSYTSFCDGDRLPSLEKDRQTARTLDPLS